MRTLYFDLETIPAQGEDIRAIVASTVKPPAQMKKTDTIAAWEKDGKPQAIADAIAKTSFNGAFGHVCCIGWALDDDPVQSVIWPHDVESEAAAIYTFKSIVSEIVSFAPVIVGHNVVDFDIRFLWQRAFVLGIRMPHWFPRDPKPWGNDIFDTMTAFAGSRNTISMDNLCAALGVPGKDDMDGSKVAEAWAGGQYERIAAYCRADVERTRLIYKKMQIALGEVAA